MLETEIKYYEKNKKEWLAKREDQFVLIKDEQLIGFYPTVESALSEGARLYGLGPYLVRQILEQEEEVYIPALSLGLINADFNGASA
jgi:hypothetical protein